MAQLTFHIGNVRNLQEFIHELENLGMAEVVDQKDQRLVVDYSGDTEAQAKLVEVGKDFGAMVLNKGAQNRAKDEFSPLKGNTKSEFAQEDPSEHMEADLSDILLDHYQDYKKTGNQASLQKAKEMAFKHYGERQSSHQLERRLAQRTQARNLNAPPSALQASIAFRNAQQSLPQPHTGDRLKIQFNQTVLEVEVLAEPGGSWTTTKTSGPGPVRGFPGVMSNGGTSTTTYQNPSDSFVVRVISNGSGGNPAPGQEIGLTAEMLSRRVAQNTTAQQIQTAFSGFSGGLQDASIARAAALFAQGRFDEGQGLFKGKLPEDVIPKVMDWVKQNFKPNPKLQTEQTLDDPKFKAWVTTYFLPYIKSLIPKRTAQQLKDSKSFSPGTAVLVHTGAAEPIPGVIKQLLENGKYHVDLGQNGEYDTPASNIELDQSKQRAAQVDDFQSVPHTRKSLSDFRAEEEWLEGVSNKFPSDEEYRKYCEALEAQFGKSVSEIVDRAPSADKMHYNQHQDTGLQEFLSVFPQVRRFTDDYIKGTGHSEQHTSEYGAGDRLGKARSAQTTPAQTAPAQSSTGVSSTPPKTPAPPGKKYIFDMTSNNWILTAV